MNCDDTCGLESWGWTTLCSWWCSASEVESEPSISSTHSSLTMSRRSLRLHTSSSHYGDDGLHDTSLNHSAIYRRTDDRSVKSRRSHQSVSLLTPKCPPSVLQAHNSTVNSCAPSDASLLSSMLDESSIQENTLVDTFWGLDEDGLDGRDEPLRAAHSTVEAKTQTSRAQNGFSHPDGRSPSSAGHHRCSSQSASSRPCPNTTVYCRESRRLKTQGVLLSAWVSCVALCKRIKAVSWRRFISVKGGNEKYTSSMSVKDVLLQKERPKFSGVLCDDCKRKGTQSSQEQAPVGDFWSLIVLTGKWASGSVLWLINVFAQCLPMLSKLLFIVPFLLLLAVWYWGPAGLLALFSSVSHHKSTNAPNKDGQTPADMNPQRASVVMSSMEMERFTRLEESLAQLWDRVAGGLLRQDEQHTEVLSLYNTLRVEFHRHTDRESMAKWIGDMLEERFSYLKGEVEKHSKKTQQNHDEINKREGPSENTRLTEAEALLQTLARKTEELQRRQEQLLKKKKIPDASNPDSDESDSGSRDDVLAEVKRLDDELDLIKVNIQGLMGCRDRCDQLDVLQNSVSDQVEMEVKSLLYGSDKANESDLPESLVQWLSDQFVSTTELHDSLGVLEKSILGNLSLQIEEGESPSEETFSRTVLHATGETGLTEDHVQMIVENALKLYSEDRTGLVDYALESGGGSIISTRCSESFETKTALMSLFGIPLWYFSQSPRAVIQPDVHPGDCWAFQGSSGYLVIGLSMRVVPTAFSLEHIPKSLSPTGHIESAPRDFSVYGLDDEWHEEGQMLGQFTYQEGGDALQTFSVTEEVTRGYQLIEVRVLSNWGNEEFTCMYRFRVHGELVDESEDDTVEDI
ncbi:SUN domain-containing protein 1 isoform X2 [Triplophysa dalaica]|uniref:SUN domain-containing protein 1 isoform X2 n=1 Tax=Triplophysa dalaica TaxID=1582913 RepID=UPI0024DFFEEA|nr:SUN domain-containing protein 1 isoform X2 [Triplophysa dalaica]